MTIPADDTVVATLEFVPMLVCRAIPPRQSTRFMSMDYHAGPGP